MIEDSDGDHVVNVTETDTGARLDRVLAGQLDGLSRSRVQALLLGGNVTCDGATIREPSHRVKPGERYVVTIPSPEPSAPAMDPGPLDVVYEDAHLIVVDKPPGLVVHPAAGHASGTLVDALIAHCGSSLSGIGGVLRPGIVHRLDKDTSGLLVVAKSDAAHQGLAEQFAAHGADGLMSRRYLALVWGMPDHPRGSIDAALARSRQNRTKIAVTRGNDGRHAVTHYQVLEVFRDADGRPVASLLALELETGRTHQIRVHLSHIGLPVLGDQTYGRHFTASVQRLPEAAGQALAALGRQALHATALGFRHPITGKAMMFERAPPADMMALLTGLRGAHAPATAPAKSPLRRRRGPKRSAPSE